MQNAMIKSSTVAMLLATSTGPDKINGSESDASIRLTQT
jgi:hypothetical protein